MSTAQEQPVRPRFWDTRTGWSRLKQLMFLEPLPGGARWSAAFGSLLLFTFVLQVITGILLALNYVPSTEPVQVDKPYVNENGETQEKVPSAWASVRYIQEEVPFGAVVRGVHHWGSSAMVLFLLFHLVQVFVWGAYKKPRELTWMTGVLLLACVLGLAFTGYLLPWDQKAYWATKVGVGIASTTPVIGDGLRTLLQGGSEMGNLTLTRFFTFHGFVLPGLVVLLIVVHLYFFRVHGVTPLWSLTDAQLKAKEEPFWPKQVLMDAVLALAFLVSLGLWVYFRAAPLEGPANPSKPYEARPEWYFMFLFQLLRYFHGPYEVLGTFVLPVLFFLVLFFWPLLDRNPQRSPRRRPIAIGLLSASTAALIGLTVFAILSDVRMKEPAQAAAKSPNAAEAAGPIQRADVARTFATNCAACHGVDGSASQTRAAMPTIPDFTSLAWQMSQTEIEIAHRIEDGREPVMPAYRDKLPQREILALTIYVRAFRPEVAEPVATRPAQPTPKPDASQMPAAQLFGTYCLACHDATGRGSTVRAAMPDIPDFHDAKWKDKWDSAELKRSVLEGKGKFMLPMKDKLSDKDVDRLLKYLRDITEGKEVVRVEPPKPVVEPPPTKPLVIPQPKTQPAESADKVARMRAATGLFRQYCLVCHGNDGRGSDFRATMPKLPDFTSANWQTAAAENPHRLSAVIRDGNGLMPSFAGRVTDDQARDLTAYVLAFGPAKASKVQTPDGDFEKQFGALQDQWNELQKQLDELSKPPSKR